MTSLRSVLDGLAEPGDDARPMVRWWWFGPQVDRSGIARQLQAMRAAGLGGAEVSFVYPLTEESEEFGSRAFLEHLDYAAATAAELGLRLDLTLGSGWSYGGGHIGPEHAARGLRWEVREIGAATHQVTRSASWPGDELLAVFLAPGAPGEAAPGGYEPVPAGPAAVTIPPGAGPRTVLLVWSVLTGQQVKRAAKGAEGPVLDHYSAAATRAHLSGVADPLLAAAGPDRIGAVFCDSLEVYGSDYTVHLPEEFTRRRGYDPLPHLYLLRVDGPGHAAFRADYYRTLSELYEENFVAVLGRWAQDAGVALRIQNYGEPPATISSYRHAQAFEGEGWGWLGLPETRWAAAAAHRYERSVVSAEAFTWVHSPSLRATPLDLKGEAHEHFLSGVNQFYMHGWPYSAEDAPGVGNLFYAAGALDDRNPWWPVMPELSRYLTRLGWLLRQGRAVADVAVLVPSAAIYAEMGTGGPYGCNLWRGTARALGDIPARIRTAGLDFDLLDDDALAGLDPHTFRAVVVPGLGPLGPQARVFLRAARDAGVAVLTIDDDPGQVQPAPERWVTPRGAVRRGPEESVPGDAAPSHAVPHDAELGEVVPADRLAEVLIGRIGADCAVRTGAGVVGVVHRDLGPVQVYLVVNTGAEQVRTGLRPRAGYSGWALVDPTHGTVLDARTLERADDAPPWIEVELAPYGAQVLITGTADEPWPAPGQQGMRGEQGVCPREEEMEIGGWSAGPMQGPQRPVLLPHVWESDDDVPAHLGSLRYEAVVTIPGRAWAGDAGTTVQVLLDLGPTQPIDSDALAERGLPPQSFRAEVETPVGEVAEVIIDGSLVGHLWAPPYRIDITEALRAASGPAGPDGGGAGPTEHRIELVVHSVGSRAVAADTGLPDRIEATRRRHGVRFRMQDLQHATTTVVSGLRAAPRLLLRHR